MWNQSNHATFIGAHHHDGAAHNPEIMMMQQTAQTAATKSVPQHVLERMESEWKQMRDSAPVVPAKS